MFSTAGRSGFPFIRVVMLASLVSLPLAGCGDPGTSEEVGLEVEDIDQESSVTATEEEVEDFDAPADSVLTAGQLDAYLRTVLLQFDLLRQERENLQSTVQTMEQREQAGGTLNQLQNMLDAGSTLVESLDVVGGSYVRSARSLGFNPAEMEWVQERMGEIAGHLMMLPMHAQSQQAAADMRAEAERMRAENTGANANPEVETYARQMLEMADQMETSSQAEPAQSVARNLEVLRSARSAVTDEMWAAIGFAAGTSGFIAISGLENDDPEVQGQLDALRQVYQDALDNRAGTVPTF